jgi:hypothetical protein
MDKANEVIELNSFLLSKNIPFVFSVVSYKIEKAEVPIIDNEVSNKEYLKDTIRNVGISVIDWSEDIDKSGKDFFSMYYKTDHHWKAESGLWATGVIAKFCKNQYGFSVSVKSSAPASKYAAFSG